MSTHEQPRVDAGRRLTFRDVLPLVGFVVPTIVTAYGSVMPRHGITGLNELTVGFASTVFGASLAYMIGLRAAIGRRPGIASPSPAQRWRRPEWIARQSARPHGIAGWILGHIMRTETATANDTTVRLAQIVADAHLLDVGCGAGHAVQSVGEQLTTGRGVGLDPSATMVRLATRRNRRLIAQGRAAIATGDVNRLPFPDASERCFQRLCTRYAPPRRSPASLLRRDSRKRQLKRATPAGTLCTGCSRASDPQWSHRIAACEASCGNLRVAGAVPGEGALRPWLVPAISIRAAG